MSDFDLMLIKKKEISKKRKRKADIDIINDNDDIIDQLLADMRHAAEVSESVGLGYSLFDIFTVIKICTNHVCCCLGYLTTFNIFCTFKVVG